jgi:hypothetical protein
MGVNDCVNREMINVFLLTAFLNTRIGFFEKIRILEGKFYSSENINYRFKEKVEMRII